MQLKSVNASCSANNIQTCMISYMKYTDHRPRSLPVRMMELEAQKPLLGHMEPGFSDTILAKTLADIASESLDCPHCHKTLSPDGDAGPPPTELFAEIAQFFEENRRRELLGWVLVRYLLGYMFSEAMIAEMLGINRGTLRRKLGKDTASAESDSITRLEGLMRRVLGARKWSVNWSAKESDRVINGVRFSSGPESEKTD